MQKKKRKPSVYIELFNNRLAKNLVHFQTFSFFFLFFLLERESLHERASGGGSRGRRRENLKQRESSLSHDPTIMT